VIFVNELFDTSRLKKDSNSIFFVLIVVIAVIIAYWRVIIQLEVGAMWDTFDFLSNAMYFAGQGFGYADFTRPPFFSFITSLFFRLGFISELTIFAVDGVFFVFGVIGLYLFFKLRFSSFQSFFACLIFVTFPIIISFISTGLSDLPAVSLSIWALYFTVLAVKRNSKFFYLSFPFFMLAFITRYPAALIVFPMIFYILINKREVNYKNLLLGVLLSILVLVPVLIFFFEKFGNPIYPFVAFFGYTQSSLLPGSLLQVQPQYNANIPVYVMGEVITLPENPFYHNDLFYFLKKFPSYVGAASFSMFIISLMGIFIYGVIKIKEKSINTISLADNKFKALIFIILLLIFILTFGSINYLVSELLFLILGFTSYVFLKKDTFRNLDIDFFFIAWFMSFFIFNSVYVLKDDRYFLMMSPAVAYFLTLGFFSVVERFKWKYKNINLVKLGLTGFLVIIILFSTTSYLFNMPNGIDKVKVMHNDTLEASNWFKDHEPDYKNKIIYADFWPYFNWYLKTPIVPMPVFKDGKLYYYRLNNYKIDNNSNIQYNKILNENKVDYYFSDKKGLNLTSYEPIKQFGIITIYQRI
jgi:4-amino-4-deoxy-L-arabinose transferase-like glycosyltransferase